MRLKAIHAPFYLDGLARYIVSFKLIFHRHSTSKLAPRMAKYIGDKFNGWMPKQLNQSNSKIIFGVLRMPNQL